MCKGGGGVGGRLKACGNMAGTVSCLEGQSWRSCVVGGNTEVGGSFFLARCTGVAVAFCILHGMYLMCLSAHSSADEDSGNSNGPSLRPLNTAPAPAPAAVPAPAQHSACARALPGSTS